MVSAPTRPAHQGLHGQGEAALRMHQYVDSCRWPHLLDRRLAASLARLAFATP
jgi:hypothetical protein